MAGSGGASSTRAIAAARAPAAPTGTSGPERPPARISAGPLGQSVLTTGQPHAIASTSTLPNPSQADDSTNRAERAIQAYGLATNPGSSTSAPTPSRSAKPRSSPILVSVRSDVGRSPR